MHIQELFVTFFRQRDRSSLAYRFLSNISWMAVGEGTGRGLNFVSNIYLARILGAQGYGIFVFVQSLLYYLGLGVDLGTSRYGTKEIARRSRTDFVPTLIGIRLTGAVAVLVITAIFVYVRHVDYGVHMMTIFGIYMLSYPFYADWIFKGLQQFVHVAISKILWYGSFLILILTVIAVTKDPIHALYLWALSYLIGNGYMGYIYRTFVKGPLSPSFDMSRWRPHIVGSMHFAISGALIALYEYMPIFLLKTGAFSYTSIGIFFAPFRISVMTSGIGFLLMEASYPIFADLYHNTRGRFLSTHTKMAVLIFTISLALSSSMYALAPQFVHIILGKEYERSVEIFRILVWLIPLYQTRYVYGSVLGATGFQLYYVPVTLVGLVMLMGGFFFFVSDDLQRAAYVLIATNLTMDVLLLGIFYAIVARTVIKNEQGDLA